MSSNLGNVPGQSKTEIISTARKTGISPGFLLIYHEVNIYPRIYFVCFYILYCIIGQYPIILDIYCIPCYIDYNTPNRSPIIPSRKRAVGQYKRKLAKTSDPHQFFCIAMLGQAEDDIEALNSPNAARRFQPGTSTNPRILQQARLDLGDWIFSRDFECWCFGAGMNRDQMEIRQNEMWRTLNGSE